MLAEPIREFDVVDDNIGRLNYQFRFVNVLSERRHIFIGVLVVTSLSSIPIKGMLDFYPDVRRNVGID